MNILKTLLKLFAVMALCYGCSDDRSDINPIRSQTSQLPRLSPTDVDSRLKRIKPKYSYVRSYPEGGGVFILGGFPPGFSPDDPLANITISLDAYPGLNVELISDFDNNTSGIIEIAIKPIPEIETDTFLIQAIIMQNRELYRIPLEVDVFPLFTAGDSLAQVKRDDFIPWLELNHPEYSDLADNVFQSYITYPQIWVVEHWTFLSDKYEVRVCWHVMIPPYDWSMLCIRERGQWQSDLALRRESDGSISEISVQEYPDFYGY